MVKPPQIPVAKNSFQLVSKDGLRSEMANTIPIIKLPMLSTKKVAIGKVLFLNQTENKNRSILPAAPPKSISNKFLSLTSKLKGRLFKC